MKKYSMFNKIDKEFYFYLGLLSTKFAIMEFNIIKFLGRLIINDFVLTNTILESNSLDKNIKLLKKINKRRHYKTTTVNELIQQIKDIKKDRNLFIHGLWGKPVQKDNDWEMSCDDPKLDYSQEEDKDRKVVVQSWCAVKKNSFYLSDLKNLTEKISDIIVTQNYLIEQLGEFEFEKFIESDKD